MPLTTRPGVFRGQVTNEWRWYVVDPAVPSPEAVRDQWERDYAGTNSPRWRLLVARVVPWSVFVVISLIWILVGTAIYYGSTPPNQVLIVAVAIGGIVGSIVGGVLSAILLFPKQVLPENRHVEVVPVPSPVEQWAPEDIAPDDLWHLARQYGRVEQLVEYEDEDEVSNIPNPPWFAPQLKGLIAELSAQEFAALETIATRLGFPIPPEIAPRSAP